MANLFTRFRRILMGDDAKIDAKSSDNLITRFRRIVTGNDSQLEVDNEGGSTPYITFSSPSQFTVGLKNGKKWNGTVEYSTDTSVWTEWTGNNISAVSDNDEYKIYLRGSNNTTFYDLENYDSSNFVLSGTNIRCDGNIENLLDYATVLRGEHPETANNTFNNLFADCTALVSAPELPLLTVSTCGYRYLFKGCTSLTTAPELPATTLVGSQNYAYMFSGCTSLTTAPTVLPATDLGTMKAYQEMFKDCTSLINAPALPATTVPATSYSSMFAGCKALEKLPALPATTLTGYCYQSMFSGCSKIKLSETQSEEYPYEYRIPTTGTGSTSGSMSLNNMFSYTGGTFTGTPTINTIYYTANEIVIAPNEVIS